MTLSSKSAVDDDESSNSENSYLNSIYNPKIKNSAPGATGNFNNLSGSSDLKSESFPDDSKNDS